MRQAWYLENVGHILITVTIGYNMLSSTHHLRPGFVGKVFHTSKGLITVNSLIGTLHAKLLSFI